MKNRIEDMRPFFFMKNEQQFAYICVALSNFIRINLGLQISIVQFLSIRVIRDLKDNRNYRHKWNRNVHYMINTEI